MSSGNAEIVRRSLEAFARGDFDAALAAFAPGAEWHTAADEPDSRTWRGTAEMRELMDRFAEPWADRFDGVQRFEGFSERGDWVIAAWVARLRGRGSGMTVEASETWAVLVERGAIVRVEEYRSLEQALAAVGGGAAP